MIQNLSRISSIQNIAGNIWAISIHAPEVASIVKPGQFINIKISEYNTPLLRRPFSVQRIDGDEIAIIFSVFGLGTLLLSQKKPGENLDIIGPLGNAFNIDGSFETAVLVAGGIGVAPLPFLTSSLRQSTRKIITFLGARTSTQIISQYLENVSIATDDGSMGYHGTVVDLLRLHLSVQKYQNTKIFACGPTPMLRSISDLILEIDVPCEASFESAMACGFGICQGCPVELTDQKKKYALVCKDGPVFDIRSIRIPANG